jgi:hypothetical protein
MKQFLLSLLKSIQFNFIPQLSFQAHPKILLKRFLTKPLRFGPILLNPTLLFLRRRFQYLHNLQKIVLLTCGQKPFLLHDVLFGAC